MTTSMTTAAGTTTDVRARRVPGTPAAAGACDSATAVTRSLLGYGIVAGPAYLVSITAQALTREGFDPLVHPASMLALGPYGWIQTVTFLVTGLMVVAAALGMRRHLRGGGRAGLWGPLLVGLFGVGVAVSAALPLDPALGFPVGTPEGPGQLSWHGIGHLVAGGIGFPCLAAAMIVVGRRFHRVGATGAARLSLVAVVAYLGCYLASVTQITGPYTTPVFTAVVVVGFTWLAVACAVLYRRAGLSR